MKTLKKIMFVWYFFLIPTTIFIYFQTDLFGGWKEKLFLASTVTFSYLFFTKTYWRRVSSLILIFMYVLAWRYLEANNATMFPLCLGGGLVVCTAIIVWLQKQYQKKGNKNIIEHIFAFQLCFIFAFWLLSYLLPSSWKIWIIMAGAIIGFLFAFYDCKEHPDEEDY